MFVDDQLGGNRVPEVYYTVYRVFFRGLVKSPLCNARQSLNILGRLICLHILARDMQWLLGCLSLLPFSTPETMKKCGKRNPEALRRWEARKPCDAGKPDSAARWTAPNGAGRYLHTA
jgi:hypothetical protein